jgi:peptide/nickel transport system permease protein
MATLAAASGISTFQRLGRVLGRRLLQIVPTLFGVSLVTFVLVRLLPGGPVQTLVGVRATPASIAAVTRQLGLSRPLVLQYLDYLGQLAHGNLGYSFLTGTSVTSIVASHLAVTIELIGMAVLLALVIGIPLATVSAYRRGGWEDQVIRAGTVSTLGLPSFWVGILLVTYLGLRLNWFPSGGAGTGIAGTVDHLFLPALTLALTFLAVVVRSLRASIAEILRAEHVDAARLKGISRLRVFNRHVLRLASLPVVALVGLNMSYLLGTSVIVENVFAIPGMGQQLVSAITQRDFLVVQGITLVFGLIVIVISTVVELVQAALDPRSAT